MIRCESSHDISFVILRQGSSGALSTCCSVARAISLSGATVSVVLNDNIMLPLKFLWCIHMYIWSGSHQLRCLGLPEGACIGNDTVQKPGR